MRFGHESDNRNHVNLRSAQDELFVTDTPGMIRVNSETKVFHSVVCGAHLSPALDISALHLGSHVVRRTPGKSKDGECGIFLGSRGESRTIHDEYILHIVHLAEAV